MPNLVRYESLGLDWRQLVDPTRVPHFSELSEQYTEEQSLLLDQKHVTLKGFTADQMFFSDNGYLIKRNFIPHDLLDEYKIIREKS